MPLEWTNDLSIGVIWIDNQHKKLVERINVLTGAIEQDRGEVEIGTTLKFLDEYTKAHFDTEEKYMLRYNYPQYQLHKKVHENFKDDLKKLRDEHKYLGATADLAKEIQKRVSNWYLDHITKVDKHLGAFLKTKVWKRGSLEDLDSIPVKADLKRDKELLEAVVQMIKTETTGEKLEKIGTIRNLLTVIESGLKS